MIGIPLFVLYYFIPQLSNMDGVISSRLPITKGTSKRSAPVLTVLSISNINPSSEFMWLPVWVAVLFALLAYRRLHRVWRSYVVLRQQEVLSPPYRAAVEHRALLLTHLPARLGR